MHRNSDMKNNEKKEKLSLSELVRRLREQAEALPDEPESEEPILEEPAEQPEGSARYRFRVTKCSRRELQELRAARANGELAAEIPAAVEELEAVESEIEAAEIETVEAEEAEAGEIEIVQTVTTESEIEETEVEDPEAEESEAEAVEIEETEVEESEIEAVALEEPEVEDVAVEEFQPEEADAEEPEAEAIEIEETETEQAEAEAVALEEPEAEEIRPEESEIEEPGVEMIVVPESEGLFDEDTAEVPVTPMAVSDLSEAIQPISEIDLISDEESTGTDWDERFFGAQIHFEEELDADLYGDTRPIDMPGEAQTVEFDSLGGADADDSLLRRYLGENEYQRLVQKDLSLETEEESAYLPHGAEAKMQDTGDITYVYAAGAEETEYEPDEELVPPEVDETDVNLMIAFGMDDELAKTLGEDQKERVEKELSELDEELSKEETFEYTSSSQNKQIFKEYKKKYRKLTVKIAICAILLLIAFLYENISFFGGKLADVIHPQIYPITHIMIDLQMVLFGAALIWRNVKNGTVSLFRLRPAPDSVVSLLLIVTIVYDIAMCFRPYGTMFYLYGFPMLLGVMCALLFELYNLKREIFSFNIVASKRIKFTIGRLEADRATLEQEAFSSYLPEDPNIFKLNKASFVDGFYARMRPSGSNRRVLMLLITFALALTAAMIGLGAVWTNELSYGLMVGYIALMMSMPLAVFLTYSLPLYRASQIAYEQDSAILGDGAIDEYAEASSISFDDRDVFPSYGVKVRSIKVFGNHRIDNIIYNAASVFRIAGGPLSDVFDIATADLGHSEDVRLLSVDSDGIEAVVSGTHLYFGKDEYLRRNHFAPMVDDDDGKVGNTSIMYMVSDDEVVAKMYIQYRIDPDFEKTLKQLYRYGICVGIKTLDPNIDDEMLSRRIRLEKYPVRILKCREAEDTAKVLERTESRLVSKHSAKALLKAFTLCSKVQRQVRTDVAINVISMLIGVVVMLLALAFGVADEVPSVYIALYQFFWAVPMYLMSKMMIQ